jgi:hypothetical protein
LTYPQKTYVYYLPPLLGALGKIYHHASQERGQDTKATVEDLVKFQCKIEVLVAIFAVVGYIVKFRWGWSKLLRIVLLLLILRLKYYQHYGCQLAWSEIHFSIDRASRFLLLREYYQELSARFSLLSNAFNVNQVVVF